METTLIATILAPESTIAYAAKTDTGYLRHSIMKILRIIFCVLSVNTAIAGGQILIPDVTILGNDIAHSLTPFPKINKKSISPLSLRYSYYRDRINVIEVSYPKEVGFAEAKKSINKLYAKFQKPDQGTAKNPLASWILPEKIEIQMKRNNNNIELVIIAGDSFNWKKR